MRCQKCNTKKGVKSYVPHYADGRMAKCSIELCPSDLKLLQEKHPEVAYIWWTKDREMDGSYAKDAHAARFDIR